MSNYDIFIEAINSKSIVKVTVDSISKWVI
jgi:hypothetical protein